MVIYFMVILAIREVYFLLPRQWSSSSIEFAKTRHFQRYHFYEKQRLALRVLSWLDRV